MTSFINTNRTNCYYAKLALNLMSKSHIEPLKKGKLRDFVKNYLKNFSINFNLPINFNSVCRNSNLISEQNFQNLFSKIFPDPEKLSEELIIEILTPTENKNEDIFLLQFLMQLTKSSNEPLIQSSKLKYSKVLEQLNFVIQTLYPDHYYDVSQSQNLNDGKRIFCQINACIASLKGIRHLESGNNKVNKETIVSLSWSGLWGGVFSNFVGDQYMMVDCGETAMIKSGGSVPEALIITDILAFFFTGGGGYLLSKRRKSNRILTEINLNLEHLHDLVNEDILKNKKLVSLLLWKITDIYLQYSMHELPPLTESVLEQVGHYNLTFPIAKYRGRLKTAQPIKPPSPVSFNPLQTPVPISSSSPPDFSSTAINSISSLNLAHPDQINADSESITGELSDYEGEVTVEVCEQGNINICTSASSSMISSFISTPSQSPIHFNPSFQENSVHFDIEQKHIIKKLIHDVKKQGYSRTALTHFANQMRIQMQENPYLFHQLHNNPFKQTNNKWRHWKFLGFFAFWKSWKQNATRGSLIGQILQIYEKCNQPEELNFILEKCLEQFNSKEPISNMNMLYKLNKKTLMEVNYKNRLEACLAVELIISRILKSQIHNSEKKLMLQSLSESLENDFEKLNVKRNIHRTENKTIFFGFQLYNLTRFIGGGKSANSDISLDIVGSTVPSIIFPMNGLFSKMNTTTKKSLIGMLNGTILYINSLENNCHSNETHAEILLNDIQEIINKPINKMTIQSQDLEKLYKIITLAKDNNLCEFIFENKHSNKFYVLNEILNRVSNKDFNNILKLIYPPNVLNLKYGNSQILRNNSCLNFSEFMAKNLKIKNNDNLSKKTTNFVAYKSMAYLIHMHENILKLKENSAERLLQEKNYLSCKKNFKTTLKGSLKETESAFRNLSETRSNSVKFFWSTVGKIFGRFFCSRIYRMVQNVALPGIGLSLVFLGYGIIPGIIIVVLGYVIRQVLSSIFDNPFFYHSKKTNSYSTIMKYCSHIPTFENHNSDSIILDQRERFNNLFQALKECKIEDVNKNLQNGFGTDLEIKIALMNFNFKVKESIKNTQEGIEEDKLNSVFQILLNECLLNENDFKVNKLNIGLQLERSIFLILKSDLITKQDKINLIDKLKINLADPDSVLGALGKNEMFVIQKRFFIIDIACSIYCLFGLVCSIFLTPALKPISPWLSSFVNSFVSALGYPLKDKILSIYNKVEKKWKYGNTKSLKNATLFLNELKGKLDQNLI